MTAPMTMNEASAALNDVPAKFLNNNCVRDAQWRLADAIQLACHGRFEYDAAPDYVVKAVNDLASWLDCAARR